MKQSPDLAQAQLCMAPGKIVLEGFLGTDTRALRAILDDDRDRLGRLGLAIEQIWQRLEYFTAAAHKRFGGRHVVDDVFEVKLVEVQGGVPCPWPHPGLYHKGVIYLHRLDTGDNLRWTELGLHMMKKHGFFGGQGSSFRLAPGKLAQVLWV